MESVAAGLQGRNALYVQVDCIFCSANRLASELGEPYPYKVRITQDHTYKNLLNLVILSLLVPLRLCKAKKDRHSRNCSKIIQTSLYARNLPTRRWIWYFSWKIIWSMKRKDYYSDYPNDLLWAYYPLGYASQCEVRSPGSLVESLQFRSPFWIFLVLLAYLVFFLTSRLPLFGFWVSGLPFLPIVLSLPLFFLFLRCPSVLSCPSSHWPCSWRLSLYFGFLQCIF